MVGEDKMVLVEHSVHQLLEIQAASTPDAEAIVFSDGRMTYAELNRSADALGAWLRSCGVGTDEPVGIFMDTCSEYIVGALATLKAGGAFMPMDVDSPKPLLRGIVFEAQPKVVLTKERFLPKLAEFSGTLILPIDSDHSWRGHERENHTARVDSGDLAFIPYTSGTTGDPKGVMLSVGAMMSSYDARYTYSSYKLGDRVGCNIFFPWEFLRPLLKGGTVYVIPDEVIFVPRALARFISEHRLSEILFTPSLLQSVLNSSDHGHLREQMASLRVVWLNGEVVPASLLRQARDVLPPEARLFNTYSISETHDVCTIDLTELSLDGMDTCPVGFRMDGVELRVRPENSSAVEMSGVGELLIGGKGVARGYLKRPDLDAERFITLDGELYYATGDLAEVAPDGMTTIVGRTDSMVKIRGYTVYLGAIEEMLRRHCDAADAAVVVETLDETSKRLVAYVVRGPNAAWKLDARSGASRDLRNVLERYLPLNSVPSHFIEMDALPINQQTGKLQRKALPSLRNGASPGKRRTRLTEHSTAAERLAVLRELWADTLELNLDDLEDDWNFFDLGGHSLAGMALTIAIEETFGTELSGVEVYEYPTIGQLARYLENDGAGGEASGATLAQDAQLDPEIAPRGEAQVTRLSEASSIFVTGTTGFLGAFLLDQLVQSTGPDTTFYCLARDGDAVDGASSNRVLDAQKFYGLPSQSEADRIVTVSGDLTQPLMGLGGDKYDELTQEIDLVFHCAASVNYVYPYSASKPHTVGGTTEILKFASAGRTKAVQYISSSGVFPGGDTTPYLENKEIDGWVDRMEGGYNQSKWVAERLVWHAVSRGLPVCLYRPGNIGHHSQTGTANPNDYLAIILKACARLGSAPEAPDWYFEMTPVDFLVSAISKIADDPGHLGRVYNVIQQDPTPADQVFNLMLRNGHITERVSLTEWKSRLQAKADHDDDLELKMLVRSLDSVEPYLTDTSVYDISRFNEALSGIGLTMPNVGADYVTMFLER